MNNFVDWNDMNAHSAAESAIRLMAEGYDYDGAVQEAARRYSTSRTSVARWVKALSA